MHRSVRSHASRRRGQPGGQPDSRLFGAYGSRVPPRAGTRGTERLQLLKLSTPSRFREAGFEVGADGVGHRDQGVLPHLLVGDAQNLGHLLFPEQMQGGPAGAQAALAGCEHEAPGGLDDRAGAFGHVTRILRAPGGTGDQHRRAAVHVLHEVNPRVDDAGLLRSPGGVTLRPRTRGFDEPGPVQIGAAPVDGSQGLHLGALGHEDEVPTLAVGGRGRLHGEPRALPQQRFRHGTIEVQPPANRSGGEQHLVGGEAKPGHGLTRRSVTSSP